MRDLPRRGHGYHFFGRGAVTLQTTTYHLSVILPLGFSGGPSTPRYKQRLSKNIIIVQSPSWAKETREQTTHCCVGKPFTGNHTRSRATTQTTVRPTNALLQPAGQIAQGSISTKTDNADTHNNPLPPHATTSFSQATGIGCNQCQDAPFTIYYRHLGT